MKKEEDKKKLEAEFKMRQKELEKAATKMVKKFDAFTEKRKNYDIHKKATMVNREDLAKVGEIVQNAHLEFKESEEEWCSIWDKCGIIDKQIRDC